MSDSITEEKIKILAQEEIQIFVESRCTPKHIILDNERKERGQEIKGLIASMIELNKNVNGKINKLYYLLFTILGGIIINFVMLWAQRK